MEFKIYFSRFCVELLSFLIFLDKYEQIRSQCCVPGHIADLNNLSVLISTFVPNDEKTLLIFDVVQMFSSDKPQTLSFFL